MLRLHVQQRSGYEAHQEPVLRREREQAPRHNVQQLADRESHHELALRREHKRVPRL